MLADTCAYRYPCRCCGRPAAPTFSARAGCGTAVRIADGGLAPGRAPGGAAAAPFDAVGGDAGVGRRSRGGSWGCLLARAAYSPHATPRARSISEKCSRSCAGQDGTARQMDGTPTGWHAAIPKGSTAASRVGVARRRRGGYAGARRAPERVRSAWPGARPAASPCASAQTAAAAPARPASRTPPRGPAAPG